MVTAKKITGMVTEKGCCPECRKSRVLVRGYYKGTRDGGQLHRWACSDCISHGKVGPAW
jgi:hypothetical protein